MTNWIKVFQNTDIALTRIAEGKTQLLILNGVRVCLIRWHDQFYAVQDSCSHNGESLSKGHINYKGEVICPWHNYQFDLTSGRECQQRSADLRTFPVKADETGFFIGL